MKRFMSLPIVAALVAAMAVSCSDRPVRSVTFEILATNDVHGRWFDESYVDDGGYWLLVDRMVYYGL